MAAFNEALKAPRVRELLEKQALAPVEPMSAGQLGELYTQDTEKYAKVIREAGIKRSD
jgi:tripartite-type tricarboxylate transporter receptor subunit TctC